MSGSILLSRDTAFQLKLSGFREGQRFFVARVSNPCVGELVQPAPVSVWENQHASPNRWVSAVREGREATRRNADRASPSHPSSRRSRSLRMVFSLFVAVAKVRSEAMLMFFIETFEPHRPRNWNYSRSGSNDH